MIGIAGVFFLVLALFVLRHFILTTGQRNRKHSVNPTMPLATDKVNINSEPEWLLWTPEPDEADSANRARDELAERRGRAQRKGNSTLR